MNIIEINCGIISIFIIALIGFFVTKKPGFRKYATALLVLILILFCSTLLIANSKGDIQILINLLFAVAGYAGGLVSMKDDN